MLAAVSLMYNNTFRFFIGKGENMKMKMLVVSAAAFALAVALASCGSNSKPAEGGSAASSGAVEGSAAVETSVVIETSVVAETSAMVGMPNPWSEVSSAEEAAKGAGIDSFSAPDNVTLSIGSMTDVTYRCMDGIAEADIMYPAVEVTVRKGVATEDGDISGDYNTYANTWEQTLKGLTVTCSGNREGQATKTIWTSNGMDYSITAQGMGGDQDFGLSADDLNSLINALQ